MRPLLIVFTLLTVSAGAQQLPSTLVNSCGGINGSTVKLISSVGEPLVGMVSSEGVQLQQGFLIPKYPGTPAFSFPDLPYLIYPNPADGFLKIRSTAREVNSCAILNMLGQRIALLPVVGNEIQVRDLSPGMYVITLMDSRKRRLATFNFIKK